eukprot:NODE_39_length_35218_cov_0.479655.p27 type:complete len:219 gc:universal NODE_39_length_35218_cov_0.479655:9525-10181(+)
MGNIRGIGDDKDEKPDLYVGSGQNVVPPRGNRPQHSNPLVQDLLQSADERQPEEAEDVVVREMVLYQNGFLLHETFYPNDSPEAEQVLKMLKSGHAPLGLLGVSQNEKVDLKTSMKLNEEYVPPFKAFKGDGNRLGAPMPKPKSQTTNEPLPNLDASDPANMTLQIRKSNGERTSVVVTRNISLDTLNQQLGGTLHHAFPRKQVESLTGCDKEVLLLL